MGQYIDRVVDVPVVKQRQVPSIQRVQKPVSVPIIETVEKIVDVPVIKQVEVPQIQTIEKVVEIPEVQTLAGATRSVNLPSAPIRQTAPAEVVQVTEIGPPLPAETAPAVVTQAP